MTAEFLINPDDRLAMKAAARTGAPLSACLAVGLSYQQHHFHMLVAIK